MFIKGNCAIYIDKNLKVNENAVKTILVYLLWGKLTPRGSIIWADNSLPFP